MISTNRLVSCALIVGAFSFISAGHLMAATPEPAKPSDPLTFFGDLRLRYEWDWDSQNSAGVARADRDRARVRARLGFSYKFSNEWSLGARARTGNPTSQQSPHLTFSANDGVHDKLRVQLDRYFVQYKKGAFTGWAGRNGSPFWQQAEIVWDDDVTPTGLAGSYDGHLDKGNLTTTVGAFYLPDGANDLNGRLVAGQLKYTIPVKPAQFIVAAGLHYFDGKDGAKFLRNRNGARDYLVGVLSAQWSRPVEGHPFWVGVDLINNFKNYSAADAAPLPAINAGKTTGYVLTVQLGQLKQPKDWLVAYYYAHIGTFAVNAAYGQDDWARFGNGAQADVTDFKGHEFRVGYAFTKNLNLMGRLFLVDALTTIQDGKRFRLDLNWKF